MGTSPSLTLDTIVPDRTTVSIKSTTNPDGRLYELRKGNELSITALQEIAAVGERAEELERRNDAGELTIEDARLLDDFTRRAMVLIFHTELEPEVLAELSMDHRQAVMSLFTETALLTPPQTETANRAERRTAPKKTKRTGAR